MNKVALLLVLALTSAGLTACRGEGDPSQGSAQKSEPAVSETATAGATETDSGDTVSEPACTNSARPVSSQSNIFGAGGSEYAAPAPGGGGGGESPPVWKLPASAEVVSFPLVEGRVTPIVSGQNKRDPNGPEGDKKGPTDIQSYGGIAGIVHRQNGMFLVGVFLGGKAPADPAPPRLDFTKNERFKVLSPKIGQTFFIGDGKRRTYRVPAGATRLFLGFADGAFYQGLPGYYSNNQGGLCVRVKAAG